MFDLRNIHMIWRGGKQQQIHSSSGISLVLARNVIEIQSGICNCSPWKVDVRSVRRHSLTSFATLVVLLRRQCLFALGRPGVSWWCDWWGHATPLKDILRGWLCMRMYDRVEILTLRAEHRMRISWPLIKPEIIPTCQRSKGIGRDSREKMSIIDMLGSMKLDSGPENSDYNI